MASDAPFFLSGTKNDTVSHPLHPSPTPPMINLDFTTPQNQSDAVFHDDDEADVDVDDDDVDDSNSPPPHPPSSVTVAIPISTATVSKATPPYPIDENRKLFQRLWTDEDEIELLQGFYEYNSQRGSSYPHHHHDTTAFYDQIKKKLQLDFNRNQLVEKLRRLKKKFRNVMQKTESGKEYVFKSPHDQATFEISKKIWGNVIGIANSAGFSTPVKISRSPEEVPFNDEDDEIRDNASLNFSSGLIDFTPNAVGVVDEKVPIRPKKRPRVISGGGGMVANVVATQFNQPQTPVSISTGVDDHVTAPGVARPNVIEETIRSCVSPIFKELLNGVMNLSNVARGAGGLAALGNMTLGLGFGGIGGSGMDLAVAGDERWRKQQILELEVFSKRLELVQDQIKVQLEELRGKGS